MKSYERAALTIWIFKGLSLASKMLCLPLLLRVLRVEEYAALVILLSLESWFLLFDCGIGLSIQNFLSESRCPEEKRASLKTALVFGLIFLGGASVLFFPLSSFLSNFFLEKCGLLFSSSCFRAAGFFLLIGMFGSIGNRIYLAEQKSFLFYALQGASSCISLILLFLLQEKISLMGAIFLVLGIPNLISFCLTLHLFKKVDFQAPFNFNVLKRGGKFGAFALMAAGVLSVDAFIMPHLLKAEEIVQYHILSKLFVPIAFTYSAWLQGFWSSCCIFWSLGKEEEIQRKIFKYSLVGVICSLLFTFTLLIFSDLIGFFLKVNLSATAIIWAGLYFSSRIVADFHAMALQTRSELTPFFYWVPLQALMSISFQWFFTSRFGVTGIFIGLTLSYLLTVCWALPRRLYRKKQKAYV